MQSHISLSIMFVGFVWGGVVGVGVRWWMVRNGGGGLLTILWRGISVIPWRLGRTLQVYFSYLLNRNIIPYRWHPVLHKTMKSSYIDLLCLSNADFA